VRAQSGARLPLQQHAARAAAAGLVGRAARRAGVGQLLQLGVPDLAAVLLLEADEEEGTGVGPQAQAHGLCLSLVARAVAAQGPGGLVEVYGEALRHQVQVGHQGCRLSVQLGVWQLPMQLWQLELWSCDTACMWRSLHAGVAAAAVHAPPAAFPCCASQELRRTLLRPEPEPSVVELLGLQGVGGLVHACLPEQGGCAAEAAEQLGALGVWQLLGDVASAAGGFMAGSRSIEPSVPQAGVRDWNAGRLP
jgi:hypothetical protein